MVVFDNIDSNRKLPWILDQYFDGVIDDSEYGIKESSKNHLSRNTAVKQKNGKKTIPKPVNYEKKNWDHSIPDDEYFESLKRISKNQIIFGANYFKAITGIEYFKPIRRSEYDKFLKENPKGWIIWDKINGENDFSDCEMIWTSFDKPSFVVYYLWAGMMQGENVSLSYERAKIQIGNKKLNEKRFHPTQKPVKFYKWLLNEYFKKGDFIADFKGGLFSIAIACHDLEINLEISEKEPDYFKNGVQRYKNHVAIQTIKFI